MIAILTSRDGNRCSQEEWIVMCGHAFGMRDEGKGEGDECSKSDQRPLQKSRKANTPLRSLSLKAVDLNPKGDGHSNNDDGRESQGKRGSP